MTVLSNFAAAALATLGSLGPTAPVPLFSTEITVLRSERTELPDWYREGDRRRDVVIAVVCSPHLADRGLC